MTTEELHAAIENACAGAVSRPIDSDVDMGRDGPAIAAYLAQQPGILAAEYDPTTQTVDVTLAPDALGSASIVFTT